MSKYVKLEDVTDEVHKNGASVSDLLTAINALPTIDDAWVSVETKQPDNGSTIEFWDLDFGHPITFENYQLNACHELGFRHWKPLSTPPTK